MKQKEFLNNMLSKLPADYDKSEGGLFWDMLSPISFELEEIEKMIEERFLNVFALTAKGEFLDKIVAEVGMSRREATKAHGQLTITGVQGTIVPRGALFASDNLIFETINETEISETNKAIVFILAKESGKKYNLPAGSINNMSVTIQGVEKVINEQETTGGYDIETDEELRTRFLIKVREPVTSGNVFHYRKWALEVAGVGDVKVFPLWNGNGTVKVIIVDNNRDVAPQELLKKVKVYIDSVRPIGAEVTVESATEKLIDLSVKLKLAYNVKKNDVIKNMKQKITDFFKLETLKTDYVSYAKIGQLILMIDGVLDYTDLKLNNLAQNVQIAETEIAKLKNVDVEEVKVV